MRTVVSSLPVSLPHVDRTLTDGGQLVEQLASIQDRLGHIGCARAPLLAQLLQRTRKRLGGATGRQISNQLCTLSRALSLALSTETLATAM